MGHGPHQRSHSTDFRSSDGSPSTLVHRSAVCGAGIDEDRIHGAVEQHEPPLHILSGQFAQSIQGLDLHHLGTERCIVRRTHRPAERRDMQRVRFSIDDGCGCRHGSPCPTGYMHRHDPDRVSPVSFQYTLTPVHRIEGAL